MLIVIVRLMRTGIRIVLAEIIDGTLVGVALIEFRVKDIGFEIRTVADWLRMFLPLLNNPQLKHGA